MAKTPAKKPRKPRVWSQDEPKRGPGYPSPYRAAFAVQAAKLVQLGATDADLADFFEVNIRSLQRWRTRYPEFGAALKQAKNEHDAARVERAAYHRAVGYTFESEKVFQYKGEIVRAGVTEHVPPDPGMLQFWLINRNPDAWRHRSEITGANGGPIQTIDVGGLTPVERQQRLAALLAMNGGAGPVVEAKAEPA